jgi:hypothetical protein
MPLPDDRNILKLGPPEYPGRAEISPAMVESVRQRIKDAYGVLTVWAVLHEDVYETQLGDGFYLHVHGLALNSAGAQTLAALGGGDSEWGKWHVRSYRLGLENDLPVFTALWRPEEEFRIGDFVALLCEIPPGVEAADRKRLAQGRAVTVASAKINTARLPRQTRRVSCCGINQY